MAKSSGKKVAASAKSKKSKQRRSWAVWVVPVILIIFILGFVLAGMPMFKSTQRSGPQFRKEGILQFTDASSERVLAQIDIEIADDDLTREQGLMWRRSMEDNQGMLFIMDQQEEQAFWMRNTYIPLDIIFVNDQRTIVKVRANTKPQSLNQITSIAPALYVVEVNAGFANQHHIQEGDKINFEREDQ